MTKEDSTKIVNFVFRCGHISLTVNMHYFFKKPSLFPCIDQINFIHSNNDQGRVYQNYKFHDPRGRGSFAKVWPYTSNSYSENTSFL